MSEKIDTDKVKSIDNPFTIMNYIYYIIDYTNRLKGLFSERQEKRTKAMKIETKRKRTRQSCSIPRTRYSPCEVKF